MQTRYATGVSRFVAKTAVPMFMAVAANASSSASFARLDDASSAACLRASGLRDAKVGAVTRFSDRAGMDARLVTGIWPQPHMKAALATMLCLYNRRSKTAEVNELAGGLPLQTLSQAVQIKDRQWSVKAIDGRRPTPGGNAPITLIFGSDGHIAANGGCNGFGGRYMLTGEGLKIYGPMIGTQIACTPTMMDQERGFQSILAAAQTLTPQPDGSLLLSAADRRTVLLGPVQEAAAPGLPDQFTGYRCGDRVLAISLSLERAIIDLEGVRTELPSQNRGDAQAPHLFTNGRITVFQMVNGPDRGISLAFGRAAAQRCTPLAAS